MGGRAGRYRAGTEDVNILFCFQCCRFTKTPLSRSVQLFLYPCLVAYYYYVGYQHKTKIHLDAQHRPSQKVVLISLDISLHTKIRTLGGIDLKVEEDLS